MRSPVFGFKDRRDAEDCKKLAASKRNAVSSREIVSYPSISRNVGDVYIVKTPPGGIGPASEESVDDEFIRTAGRADCTLYRFDDDDKMVPHALDDLTVTRPVYNFNRYQIPGDTYIRVQQEQISGKLIADPYVKTAYLMVGVCETDIEKGGLGNFTLLDPQTDEETVGLLEQVKARLGEYTADEPAYIGLVEFINPENGNVSQSLEIINTTCGGGG